MLERGQRGGLRFNELLDVYDAEQHTAWEAKRRADAAWVELQKFALEQEGLCIGAVIEDRQGELVIVGLPYINGDRDFRRFTAVHCRRKTENGWSKKSVLRIHIGNFTDTGRRVDPKELEIVPANYSTTINKTA